MGLVKEVQAVGRKMVSMQVITTVFALALAVFVVKRAKAGTFGTKVQAFAIKYV